MGGIYQKAICIYLEHIYYMLSFVKQANWAELERPGGLSYQKIKKGAFVRVEKIGF